MSGAMDMKKKRAIIIDDEPVVLQLLETFLSRRGYEVCTFSEPVLCHVFKDSGGHCRNEEPCCDIMITDYEMPGMSGIELLNLQSRRGCRIDIRNKALISGYIISEDKLNSRGISGSAFFQKPFRLAMLSAWIDECEKRLLVSEPHAVQRKETRKPVMITITYSLPSKLQTFSGVVTNLSESGFCLEIDSALPEQEIIQVHTGLPGSRKRASICWTQQRERNVFSAGCAFC